MSKEFVPVRLTRAEKDAVVDSRREDASANSEVLEELRWFGQRLEEILEIDHGTEGGGDEDGDDFTPGSEG